MGRQKKKIDKKQFEELCAMQCTELEIQAVLGISTKTLISFCRENYGDDFYNVSKMFNARGRASLRRIQMKQAEKNPTMAIWLGKQYLGQTDKVETAVNIEDLSPVANMLGLSEAEIIGEDNASNEESND